MLLSIFTHSKLSLAWSNPNSQIWLEKITELRQAVWSTILKTSSVHGCYLFALLPLLLHWLIVTLPISHHKFGSQLFVCAGIKLRNSYCGLHQIRPEPEGNCHWCTPAGCHYSGYILNFSACCIFCKLMVCRCNILSKGSCHFCCCCPFFSDDRSISHLLNQHYEHLMTSCCMDILTRDRPLFYDHFFWVIRISKKKKRLLPPTHTPFPSSKLNAWSRTILPDHFCWISRANLKMMCTSTTTEGGGEIKQHPPPKKKRKKNTKRGFCLV